MPRHRRNALPAAPPKRRFAGQQPPRQLSSSLERVRKLARDLPENERAFDPERAPTWQGSSRDLMVNGRPQMFVGTALALRRSDGYGWDEAPDSSWYRESVEPAQTRGALPEGERLIRGEKYVVFSNTYTGDRAVYHYAQLASDVGSYTSNSSRRGPQLKPGYAYEFKQTSSTSWRGSSDEDWDTVMVGVDEIAQNPTFTGDRIIDGSRCDVFQMPDDETYYAQTKVYARNPDVDPRDIPEHLTPISGWGYKEEGPESNGASYGYSNRNFGRKKSDNNGWFQVDYATGSDYSGGSVERSNYKVLSEMLEEHHPDGSEPVVWAVTPGGHGTYGIIVKYGDLADEVREAIDALEDYPLMSEEAHSELEMNEQDEAWENWTRGDFIKEIAKRTGKDSSALEDAITKEEWYGVFHLGMEASNTYWEDQGGEGPWVNLERVVDEVMVWIEEEPDKYPQYSSDYDDEALDALRKALPTVEAD